MNADRHRISPRTQPIRATLLFRLAPVAREKLISGMDFIESLLLETLPLTDDSVPFNVLVSQATLEDLEALLIHQRDAVETWSQSQGETKESLHRAMQRILGLLVEATDLLSEALKEEECHD